MLLHSETWLKNNPELIECVKIPGQQMKYRNRKKMYIRENMKYKTRLDLENVHPSLEHLWIEMPGRNSHSRVLVGVVHPSNSVMNIQEWFNSLLARINNSWDGMLILIGDMHIDLLNPVNTRQYNELLQVFHLEQMAQEPTRESKHSSTLIVHIVSKCPSRTTHTGILPCSVVSDHDGIFALPRYKFIRHMKNFDETALVNDLEDTPYLLQASIQYLSFGGDVQSGRWPRAFQGVWEKFLK